MEESKKGTFERPIIQCDYSGAYYASSLLRVYVLVLRVPWLKMTKRLEYCYLHAIYIYKGKFKTGWKFSSGKILNIMQHVIRLVNVKRNGD